LRDKHGEALSAARDEPKAQEQTGQSQWDSELRCLENITLSGLNMLEEGQNAVEEALRIAGRAAEGLELRAATSLARRWGEQDPAGDSA
jgi:hypothetical protein